MKLTTAAQMRELDRQAIEGRSIPSIDLMERAAEGVAQAALELLPRRPGRCRGAALCGAGNNGGDGIAAARLLFLRGVQIRALLVGDYEKLTPDALEETRRLSECGVELEQFDPMDQGQRAWVLGCDVVIDALFGVGLSRPVTPETAEGENFQFRMMPLAMRAWSSLATELAMAVGPRRSWEPAWVWAGPMQSDRGSPATRPSGEAGVHTPCCTLAVTE